MEEHLVVSKKRKDSPDDFPDRDPKRGKFDPEFYVRERAKIDVEATAKKNQLHVEEIMNRAKRLASQLTALFNAPPTQEMAQDARRLLQARYDEYANALAFSFAPKQKNQMFVIYETEEEILNFRIPLSQPLRDAADPEYRRQYEDAKSRKMYLREEILDLINKFGRTAAMWTSLRIEEEAKIEKSQDPGIVGKIRSRMKRHLDELREMENQLLDRRLEYHRNMDMILHFERDLKMAGSVTPRQRDDFDHEKRKARLEYLSSSEFRKLRNQAYKESEYISPNQEGQAPNTFARDERRIEREISQLKQMEAAYFKKYNLPPNTYPFTYDRVAEERRRKNPDPDQDLLDQLETSIEDITVDEIRSLIGQSAEQPVDDSDFVDFALHRKVIQDNAERISVEKSRTFGIAYFSEHGNNAGRTVPIAGKREYIVSNQTGKPINLLMQSDREYREFTLQPEEGFTRKSVVIAVGTDHILSICE